MKFRNAKGNLDLPTDDLFKAISALEKELGLVWFESKMSLSKGKKGLSDRLRLNLVFLVPKDD